MHYIVLDLEFNQEPSSSNISADRLSVCPYEIIQIGAIKLDSERIAVASFNRYIKPTIYLKVSDFVSELTGITTQRLLPEKKFPQVLDEFIQFIGNDPVLCTWGMTDIKELYRNARFYDYNLMQLPDVFINIQPYVSVLLKQSPKKLFNLQAAVEALSIPISYPFHNALYDAYYTTQLFKKLSALTLQPEKYIPDLQKPKRTPAKQVVDYEGLLEQFKKMYQRNLTREEQSMITLAYKMGRTHQFVKKQS